MLGMVDDTLGDPSQFQSKDDSISVNEFTERFTKNFHNVS